LSEENNFEGSAPNTMSITRRFTPFAQWIQRMREGTPEDPQEAARKEQEIDALIEEASEWVVRRRLETPALLFLETHKPLTSLASHSVIFATPLLAPLFGLGRMEQLQTLMESSANIDRLMDRIEEKAEAR
jgi:hypothetical protein